MIFRTTMSRFSRSLLVIGAMILMLAITFGIYVDAEKRIDEVNWHRHNSLVLIHALRRASDDLTRNSRTYVITGEPAYPGDVPRKVR